jgi:hypothetical protein
MEVKRRKAYSFLLGLYLGDGSIYKDPTCEHYRLTIALDMKHLNLISETVTAMECVFEKPVQEQDREGCINLKLTVTNFMDLFPQYGTGFKHDRKIELAEFQKEIVEEFPEMFLRGLIASDGSICYTYTNPKYKEKLYKTYTFSNRSSDIFSIFIWALSLVGIDKQMPNFYANRIYKITIRDKASVKILETEVISEKS